MFRTEDTAVLPDGEREDVVAHVLCNGGPGGGGSQAERQPRDGKGEVQRDVCQSDLYLT